jgi:hypothetical protein
MVDKSHQKYTYEEWMVREKRFDQSDCAEWGI